MSDTEPTWKKADTDAAVKFSEWLEHEQKLDFYADYGEYKYMADEYDEKHSLIS